MFFRIILLVLFLFLNGCSLFSPVKTENITAYQINKVPSVPVTRIRRGILVVATPETSSTYNNTDMVYSTTSYTVAAYAKSRWAEPPAKMIQQVLVQALTNSGRYRVVVAPPFVGSYDYLLTSQLVEVRQDFTRYPSVERVTLRAQLLRMASGRVVAAQQFKMVAFAPQNSPLGGVIAANRAVSDLARKIVIFCVKNS